MPLAAIPLAYLIAEALIAATVVVGGAIVLSKLAEIIGEWIAENLSDAIERARQCRNCENCPECIPPRGTVGYRIDWVPPSRPHAPCPGSHVHLYVQNQNPNNCQCFWAPPKRNGVICIPDNVGPDDFDPSDLGEGVVPMPNAGV